MRRNDLREALVKKAESIKYAGALKVSFDILDIIDKIWDKKKEATETESYIYSMLISLLSCKSASVVRLIHTIMGTMLYDEEKRKVVTK
ncbi:hypothetical protein IMSAG049_00046 [Clostridiales bacterium]|nr:hypothetical protein IMSAG049_00046 [Clostridiales bacterium]